MGSLEGRKKWSGWLVGWHPLPLREAGAARGRNGPFLPSLPFSSVDGAEETWKRKKREEKRKGGRGREIGRLALEFFLGALGKVPRIMYFFAKVAAWLGPPASLSRSSVLRTWFSRWFLSSSSFISGDPSGVFYWLKKKCFLPSFRFSFPLAFFAQPEPGS